MNWLTVILKTGLVLAATALLCACASRPINDPISEVDLDSGYRPALLIPQRENNELSTLFILSFSGGGTRAAAFSYGVLEELRRVKFVAPDGSTRSLVNEVDSISGVSGGSFTALAYALYGERLFDEYEERFLKRNVQGALARKTFNPFNWPKLMSGNFGRSELAAEYYDEILFEGAVFNDLLDRHDVPIAFANGTDITTGSRIAFFQEEFDLLCSDVGTVHLSRAAATSSAVPSVLSPVTLNNYGGTCGYQWPMWVEDILSTDIELRPAGRSLERYKQMAEFRDGENRPYIHLVDGGVSDNIGVRGIIDVLEQMWVSQGFADDRGFGVVRNIVILIVNARSEHPKNWQQKESPPGSIKQLVQSSGVPIERYSFETIELLKDRAEIADWRRRMLVAEAQLDGKSREEAEALYPDIGFQVIDVSFESIVDPERRDFFMNLPTSFVLDDEEVDALREVAGELLNQSPEYHELLSELDLVSD